MFAIWIILAVAVLALGCFVAYYIWANKGAGPQAGVFAICCIAVAMAFLVFAFSSPSGKLKLAKLTATTGINNWLVVDRSGGQTMCHWILEDGYVTASTQSDGWEFYESTGNQAYVSGGAIVVRIDGDLASFEKTYKRRYNIPEDQPALR